VALLLNCEVVRKAKLHCGQCFSKYFCDVITAAAVVVVIVAAAARFCLQIW